MIYAFTIIVSILVLMIFHCIGKLIQLNKFEDFMLSEIKDHYMSPAYRVNKIDIDVEASFNKFNKLMLWDYNFKKCLIFN